MKNLVMLLAAAMITSCINAQKILDKDVPTTVRAAFQKQYPNVKKVKWEKEKANYEAGFENNKTEYSVLIDVSGNIVETEAEIKVDELPAKARAYISKNYTGQKIKEAATITKANREINYEAELKSMDLIFDATGNFIREDKD